MTEVMDWVHDLQLQLLQEIGFVREIDQALSKSLMAEFLRLKVVIGDDLSGALRTWQTDMDVATEKLLRDLDAATQASTTLPSKNAAVGVALRQFRAASQLRVALPLTQLDEAREELGTFIQFHLEELRSPLETKNLIGELSSRITDHRGQMRELLRSEPLRHPEVTQLVMVGLAADRPIESNFFPSLLEGLLGSLGMATPREGNPSPPRRARATHGLQPCVEQSPELNRRRLRHQKWWGCLPTWTSSTKRVYSINKDISYHPSSRTRSSFLMWLKQYSGWPSPWWGPRHFLQPIAMKCHPPHLSQGAVGPSSRY